MNTSSFARSLPVVLIIGFNFCYPLFSEAGNTPSSQKSEPVYKSVPSSDDEQDQVLQPGAEELEAGIKCSQRSEMVEARKYYEKAARAGNAKAMTLLGTFYMYGRGDLERDEFKAEELHQSSSKLGCREGMYNLGLTYLTGKGRSGKDEVRAVELFQESENLGLPEGMAMLGRMHESGRGNLDVNTDLAFELYGKSADLGCPAGMALWVEMYLNKQVRSDEDEARAEALFQQPVKLGRAITHLARNYQNGFNFPPDEARAIKLFQKAAELGDERARDELLNLQKHLASLTCRDRRGSPSVATNSEPPTK